MISLLYVCHIITSYCLLHLQATLRRDSSLTMLSVEDVMNIRIHRSSFNHDLYKDLLQKCYDKILWYARMGHSSAFFYIRPLQFDRPLVNTRNAYNYIRDKLEKGNFKVETITDGSTYLLIITWIQDRTEMLRQWIDHRVNQG